MNSVNLKNIIGDLSHFPKWQAGISAVWMRNFLFFRYTFLISVFWVFVEPLLFLGAIGFGLGGLIDEVEGISYLNFFIPGLMVASGMMVSFYETTYSSYTKLTRQKTFDSILLTPIGPSSIAVAEILWAAFKGWLSSQGVLIVGLFFGLIPVVEMVPLTLLNFFSCLGFASFGFLITTLARTYDSFIYAQTGFIMPMYLFSGTYFPLSQMPEWGQVLAHLLPLTHVVKVARSLCLGTWDSTLLGSLFYTLIFIIVCTNISCARLERRLSQ